MSLSTVITGVSDKTKTKDFQVRVCQLLDSVNPRVKKNKKQLCFFRTEQITGDLLFFSRQWSIYKDRKQLFKWEKVGSLFMLIQRYTTVFDT